MKPFLLLQLRPEVEAADEEYASVLKRGDLQDGDLERIRLDQDPRLGTVALDNYSGVIVGGGPGCVSDPADRKSPAEARSEAAILSLLPEICTRDIPYMGCCYGLGVLVNHLGGRMGQGRYGEPVGGVDCSLTAEGKADALLAGLPAQFRALVGHKEAVEDLPPNAVHLATSEPCPVQMIRHKENVYAAQFHPEADGESFATRIRIYRDRGYFPPEEADDLKRRCLAEDATVPPKILRRFITKYGRSSTATP